jgi:hypothetical protein
MQSNLVQIQVWTGYRWRTLSFHDDQVAALRLADRHRASGAYRDVRVVKEVYDRAAREYVIYRVSARPTHGPDSIPARGQAVARQAIQTDTPDLRGGAAALRGPGTLVPVSYQALALRVGVTLWLMALAVVMLTKGA